MSIALAFLVGQVIKKAALFFDESPTPHRQLPKNFDDG
jgi:hypothetical protein